MKSHKAISLFIMFIVLICRPPLAEADPVIEAPAFQLGTFNLGRVPVLTYEDENISVTLQIYLNRLLLELKNSTPGIVIIDRDKFFFTDAEARVSRMIHDGVQFQHRDRPQGQVILSPGGRIRTSMVPLDNIWWNDQVKEYETITIKDEEDKEKTIKIPKERDRDDNGNWEIRELAPWPPGGRLFNSEEKFRKLYSGKRLSLLMTLVFNGLDTRYYVFNFDFPVYETAKEREAAHAQATMDRYLILGEKTKNGFIVIKGVASGSLAEKKGIMAGDILMEIDGISVTGMEVDSVREYISKKAEENRSMIIVTGRNGERNITILK